MARSHYQHVLSPAKSGLFVSGCKRHRVPLCCRSLSPQILGNAGLLRCCGLRGVGYPRWRDAWAKAALGADLGFTLNMPPKPQRAAGSRGASVPPTPESPTSRSSGTSAHPLPALTHGREPAQTQHTTKRLRARTGRSNSHRSCALFAPHPPILRSGPSHRCGQVCGYVCELILSTYCIH